MQTNSAPNALDRLLAKMSSHAYGHEYLLLRNDNAKSTPIGANAEPFKLCTFGGLWNLQVPVAMDDAKRLIDVFPGITHQSMPYNAEKIALVFSSLPMSRRIFALNNSQSTTQRTVGLYQDGAPILTVSNERPGSLSRSALVGGQLVWDLYDPDELCARWGELCVEDATNNGMFRRSSTASNERALSLFTLATEHLEPIEDERSNNCVDRMR